MVSFSYEEILKRLGEKPELLKEYVSTPFSKRINLIGRIRRETSINETVGSGTADDVVEGLINQALHG